MACDIRLTSALRTGVVGDADAAAEPR